MKLAVVGGGIAGLAAAYELTRRAPGADVVLFEADGRLGGKVLTTPFAGRMVDEAADAFLARVPWAVELCTELGLAGELVSPAEGAAYVWSRGALRRLPDGLVLGVPTDLEALARSGIVSDAGLRRAAADLELVAPAPGGDESVGALIRRRLGEEVLTRLVDPLLGGINAGDADNLSLAAGAAQLQAASASAGDGSLIAALRAQRDAAASAPSSPVFYSLRGGLGRLVERLAEEISADVRLHSAARVLERRRGGWLLDPTTDETFHGVVLATPAFVTAPLLHGPAPESAELVSAVDYSSVALVTIAWPAAAVDRPLDASGFLVPRTEGLLVTGCSWATSKWAHLADPSPDGAEIVIRASVGRAGEDHAVRLANDILVRRVLDDLAVTMGVHAEPVEVRISRWPRAFPQYPAGHLDHVAAIDRALAASAPGVVVAGAAYRGLGVPACINQGRDAAARLLAAVAS